MRRTDREITDPGEIFGILQRCTSMNLGMNSPDYPYVIPMTFGSELTDRGICVYFHCANEGRKLELIEADNRVCVEAHIYERIEQTESGDITARYESVIGFGRVFRITEQKDKVRALKVMLDHYNSSGFPVTSCKGLSKVEVYGILLEDVTGKRNL